MTMVSVDLVAASERRLHEPLVLLPGWGFGSDSWQPLLPLLQQWTDIQLLDYRFETTDPDTLCDRVVELLPPAAILCGWSLGGMLATRIAARYPQRVRGLITLSANASFVAKPEWPRALAQATFERFCQKFRHNPRLGLQRFCGLVSHGQHHGSDQREWLRDRLSIRDTDDLSRGLTLLGELDNSQLLSRITCPAVCLFGSDDVLVPATAAAAMASVLPGNQQVHLLEHTGHLLHYPLADTRLMQLLSGFLSSLVREVVDD